MIALAVMAACGFAKAKEREKTLDEISALKPMQGQVVHYASQVYNDLQPFAICTTDLSDKPKPLIVDLVPGTYSRLERAAKDCEYICKIAAENGLECVAIRPSGRGNGSVYQGYGEVDVYEAIDAVMRRLAIDPERISVTGVSMGGAATWYHASHTPDFWSAAAPFCGYCDYKLWDKPGGTTFHRQAWEEPSWIARGAAYRVPNLRNVALRIVHGEWDRAVAGGVPVEHSRQMSRKLIALDIPHEYIEISQGPHGRDAEQWQKTIPWLLRQKRDPDPNRISLVVHTLRHARAYWIQVLQQKQYGRESTVEARFDAAANAVSVETRNVRRIEIGPILRSPGGTVPRSGAVGIPGPSRLAHGPASQDRATQADKPDAAILESAEGGVTVTLDGTTFEKIGIAGAPAFVRASDGRWSQTKQPIPDGEKRPHLAGPFGDLFYEPTVIIRGTCGSTEQTRFNEMMARNIPRTFRARNGGVHRGGIMGENSVPLPVLTDEQYLSITGTDAKPIESAGITIDKALLQRSNLWCIGHSSSNAVLARLASHLPVRYGEGEIELGGLVYRGQHLAFFAIFPHPDHRRYVALLSGIEPDAITWGSHVGHQLLPDYLIFDHDRIVDWGFWNNHWRHTEH